jgi:hypothetical protein
LLGNPSNRKRSQSIRRKFPKLNRNRTSRNRGQGNRITR